MLLLLLLIVVVTSSGCCVFRGYCAGETVCVSYRFTANCGVVILVTIYGIDML